MSDSTAGYDVHIDRVKNQKLLLHLATSRKVAGSIPEGLIGIFYSHNPSGRTMAPEVDSACNRNEYQEYFLGEFYIHGSVRRNSMLIRYNKMQQYAVRVSCTPDDGCDEHPKHLEQFYSK